jgi:hypothetical protein
MNDQMIICKNLIQTDKIESLSEWFDKCPPQKGIAHWKDGRSAKETAKLWLSTIPTEFQEIVKPFGLKFNVCSPEYVTRFDKNGGNGRNHDLIILAEDEVAKPVVISIESKVDETYGDTVSITYNKAEKRFKKNERSLGIQRIIDLKSALFGDNHDDLSHIRYQLITAVAGTIAEAKKQKAKTAILLIQTFITSEIDNKKHQTNQKDLDNFINVFSYSVYNSMNDGQLLGPLRIANKTEFLDSIIDLWIGKYSIKLA